MSRKIAIPTVGDQVNPHFGRSEAFTLLTIEDQKVTSQEIIATADYKHQHEGIAQLLKSKKVETVICGGIGPGAIAGLENAGIEVLRGDHWLSDKCCRVLCCRNLCLNEYCLQSSRS